MPRYVQPELLDLLPASDPRAVRSRRDLRRVNAWMQHAAIMARALRAHGASDRPGVLLDLGAGDGTFMLHLARRLAPRWPGCTAILLDRQDIVSAETRAQFGALSWTVETVGADVFDFLGSVDRPKVDVVTANLFLHHFHDDVLSRLLARVAQWTPLLVACEPRRGGVARLGSRLLWAIGCNGVTRYDAAVSVDAGFRGAELSASWPEASGWDLRETAAGLFSHSFLARRRTQGPDRDL